MAIPALQNFPRSTHLPDPTSGLPPVVPMLPDTEKIAQIRQECLANLCMIVDESSPKAAVSPLAARGQSLNERLANRLLSHLHQLAGYFADTDPAKPIIMERIERVASQVGSKESLQELLRHEVSLKANSNCDLSIDLICNLLQIAIKQESIRDFEGVTVTLAIFKDVAAHITDSHSLFVVANQAVHLQDKTFARTVLRQIQSLLGLPKQLTHEDVEYFLNLVVLQARCGDRESAIALLNHIYTQLEIDYSLLPSSFFMKLLEAHTLIPEMPIDKAITLFKGMMNVNSESVNLNNFAIELRQLENPELDSVFFGILDMITNGMINESTADTITTLDCLLAHIDLKLDFVQFLR